MVIELPYARHWPGDPPREPWMALRAFVPREAAALARRELAARGARGLRVAVGPTEVVITAEAPLAVLLGWPQWLDAATGGRADTTLALARYVPLAAVSPPDEPPDTAGVPLTATGGRAERPAPARRRPPRPRSGASKSCEPRP